MSGHVRLEKNKVHLKMAMNIGSPSEPWFTLTRIPAEMKDAAYDRVKNDLRVTWKLSERDGRGNFACVSVVFSKLQ